MNRAAEPYRKVSQIVNAFAASRVLHVASELDLFTAMANQGKTSAQLASQLDLQPEALELLLNALTSLGFLRKESERFYDTPIAHTYLSRTGPRYIGHLIRSQASGWGAWGHLRDALRRGKPVPELERGATPPTSLEDSIRGQHEQAVARGDARWLARYVSLSRCRSLLNLGGPGTYAAHFCRANPQLRATLVDLPPTLEITRRILRDFEVGGRAVLVAGDTRRDAIPGGPYDAALVSNLLHAETEAANRQLLQRVHAALVPGGLIMTVDHVMNAERTEPQDGALLALEMLLTTRGRTYSFDEIAGWLTSAGFRDMTAVSVPPPSNATLLMALRPGKRALVSLPRPAALHAAPPPAAPPAARAAWTEPPGTPPARPPARPPRPTPARPARSRHAGSSRRARPR